MFYLTIINYLKGDTEAERQGEILAFYGEEETRNYDSPEPGPVIEKDDAATKETAGSEQVGQNFLLRIGICRCNDGSHITMK